MDVVISGQVNGQMAIGMGGGEGYDYCMRQLAGRMHEDERGKLTLLQPVRAR